MSSSLINRSNVAAFDVYCFAHCVVATINIPAFISAVENDNLEQAADIIYESKYRSYRKKIENAFYSNEFNIFIHAF